MKCGTCGQELPPDKLEVAGRKVADAMVKLWNLDIIDPQIGSKAPRAAKSLGAIEEIIKLNGWSWALPYKGNGPPQWCGMTAGAAWAGAGLNPVWLPTYFASTYRLMLWATYQKFDQKSVPNPDPGHNRKRLYLDLSEASAATTVPRPGDIVIVGDGDPRVGDHVTICVSFANGVFDTISGNGRGRGPKGDTREGVSRKAYAIGQSSGYRPLWLIRPAAADLL